MLHDPTALGVSAGLALMLAAVVFSLSRGGLIALAIAGVVTLVLRAARSSRPGRWGGTVLATALALGLLAWLGTGPLQARLSTLWEGDALQDGRSGLWADVLPAARDFPLAGTGYGSFERVELVYRTTPTLKAPTVVEHAPGNDYLEALVEGRSDPPGGLRPGGHLFRLSTGMACGCARYQGATHGGSRSRSGCSASRR